MLSLLYCSCFLSGEHSACSVFVTYFLDCLEDAEKIRVGFSFYRRYVTEFGHVTRANQIRE